MSCRCRRCADPDDSRRGCLVYVSLGRLLCRYCTKWHRPQTAAEKAA